MDIKIDRAIVIGCKYNAEKDSTAIEFLETGQEKKSSFRISLGGNMDLVTGDLVTVSGVVTGWVMSGLNYLQFVQHTIEHTDKRSRGGGEK